MLLAYFSGGVVFVLLRTDFIQLINVLMEQA